MKIMQSHETTSRDLKFVTVLQKASGYQIYSKLDKKHPRFN